MSGKRKRDAGAQEGNDGPVTKRRKARGGQLLTVEEILSDKLTQIANAHWAPSSSTKSGTFDANLVENIYTEELKDFSATRLMLLELSQYLESYLWPNFDPEKATFKHLMSIILMVNEKFREGVSAWDCFHTREEVFPKFFERVLCIENENSLNMQEKTFYIRFLINSFQSLEDEMVRKLCLKMVALPIWRTLNAGRREKELKGLFKEAPKLKPRWAKLQKQEKKPEKKKQLELQTNWLPNLIDRFLETLYTVPATGKVDLNVLKYCERFLEFMIDLNVQLPTRRFFNTVLDEKAVLVKCKLAPLSSRPDAKLFVELVNMLKFYCKFEIDDYSGDALSDEAMTERHCSRLVALQRCSFKNFPELSDLSLSQIAGIQTRQSILPHLMRLQEETLKNLAVRLRLLDEEQVSSMDRTVLLEYLVFRYEKRLSQLNAINGMPLFPTESDLYDESVMPEWEFKGDSCLALPKLNLQFLTLYDYLLRNFTLYRLESTYEIRQDLEDVIGRMAPRQSPDGRTIFTGWARMALPVQHFEIKYVSKPDLGDIKPARVKAELVFALTGLEPRIRQEWDSFRRHDVIFLISTKPRLGMGEELNPDMPFNEAYGIESVRGAEIVAMLDADGKEIDELHDDKDKLLRGDRRTVTVLLDSAQFQKDVEEGKDNLYQSFNLVIRRRPKENNFKAVLETIRDLMNARTSVPSWIHDIFLGYGDPSAAHYTNMEGRIYDMDFHDTFLDADHVRSALSHHNMPIRFSIEDVSKQVPPFRVRFPKKDEEQVLIVTPYKPDLVGPYPHVKPKLNAVRFTPVQVEAITAGINPGLTMVVGPPGTGKTDTAVQIILNLYKNFPEQRTILVTHSNQALNQLFEKIVQLDIDERHVLRLGRGHEDLETTRDFSRHGRVNFMLDQRLKHLEEVGRLASSLGVSSDVAYTCETAGHFFLFHVVSRWEEFENARKEAEADSAFNDGAGIQFVQREFPFHEFFSDAPQPLFKKESYEDDLDVAVGCYRYLENIFKALEECRAFELLRNGTDRANYLVTTQARIIAMTCTHAALKRRDLIRLGFKYDNLVMEESAQILEVETFIPMLLQGDDISEGCRLKRAILIGDHHQLPPVVQNMAFQKYGHLDQSMFTRFVRLQVPTIDLDMQGRARPSLASLYKWRYKKLDDLPAVKGSGEYAFANTGFAHDFQFIDVGDLDGKGETTPNPYFYQNLAEAEYIVAVYMYMRLIGYPAEKISILTTYNGQKHLLRDVVEYRCARNPAFGRPRDISTVDKFQGNQNDYILLSLVRTKSVGHIRDVRRLVVAVSRARLGLYIFGRKSLFEQCYELTPTFSLLLKRPVQLELTAGEVYPTTRKVEEEGNTVTIRDLTHMGSVVNDMAAQQMLQYQTQHSYAAETMKPTEEDFKTSTEH